MQSLKESKSVSQLSRTRRKNNKIVSLAKTKLHNILLKFWFLKPQNFSYINRDKFFSIYNVLGEYEMKQEIKSPENATEYTI